MPPTAQPRRIQEAPRRSPTLPDRLLPTLHVPGLLTLYLPPCKEPGWPQTAGICPPDHLPYTCSAYPTHPAQKSENGQVPRPPTLYMHCTPRPDRSKPEKERKNQPAHVPSPLTLHMPPTLQVPPRQRHPPKRKKPTTGVADRSPVPLTLHMAYPTPAPRTQAGHMCRVGRRWTWAFSTSGGVCRVSGRGLAGLALVRGHGVWGCIG